MDLAFTEEQEMLRQSARLGVTAGVFPGDWDVNAYANAVIAFVVDVVEGPNKGTRFAFDSARPSTMGATISGSNSGGLAACRKNQRGSSMRLTICIGSPSS